MESTEQRSMSVLGFFLVLLPLLTSCAHAPNPDAADRGVAARESSLPEKWDFQTPRDEWPISDFQARKLSNGDVLLSYQSCCGNDRWRNTTFFGNRRYKSVEEAFHGAFPPPLINWQLKTIDGETIVTYGTHTSMLSSRGCYTGLEASVSVFDKNGPGPGTRVPTHQKTLLYLFDAPKTYTSRPGCNESRTFEYWAESLGGNLVPLEDRTFLVMDSVHGVVIRMTEQLQTKSSLVGDRLFIIDTDRFLSRFGAQYGARSDGGRDFQKLHIDLHRWLLQSKGRR